MDAVEHSPRNEEGLFIIMIISDGWHTLNESLRLSGSSEIFSHNHAIGIPKVHKSHLKHYWRASQRRNYNTHFPSQKFAIGETSLLHHAQIKNKIYDLSKSIALRVKEDRNLILNFVVLPTSNLTFLFYHFLLIVVLKRGG